MIAVSPPESESAANGAARAGVVVLAGLTSAMHIGKLPPALPVLQADFHLSLVQVSWMVSLFMLGPALIGTIAGSVADRFDARRTMITGLLLSAVTSVFGAFASSPGSLFASRALESVSYLMTVLPAPALIARLVPRARVRGWLGAWSAYMPAGMGIALLATPALMDAMGWRGVWLTCAALSVLAAALVALVHPMARDADVAPAAVIRVRIATLVRQTMRSPGPRLLALCFLFYAGQFTAIFSFLPSIYQDAGLSSQWSATLTAIAVMVSMSGNFAAGFLLQHGVSRAVLVVCGGLAMAACAWLAFGSSFGFASRYASILLFAASAGLIPGTLFATVPFYAPSQETIFTTVGMMQQGSSLGQLLLPPVVAALAQYTGGWQSIWIATGAAAMVTVAIGTAMTRVSRSRG
ncbi:MAG: MFS transporter [Burkholderiaceae bacterium]|nr:MFS transporter [Burkholderiaceae bacterium]